MNLKKFQLKGRTTTKPGTLLKHHILVRTFSHTSTDTATNIKSLSLEVVITKKMITVLLSCREKC
ncbi:MAG: hypothetical protein QME58_02705 [Bacteroidota bacterium]|nr:hypothetical protein [Bacteroidota bacterium]